MAGRLEAGVRRLPLSPAAEPSIEPAVAGRAMAGFSDRMFMDLGHFEPLGSEGSNRLFADLDERSERIGPVLSEQRRQAEIVSDAALRIDDVGPELTATRHKDDELVDRLFAELADEEGQPQDKLL